MFTGIIEKIGTVKNVIKLSKGAVLQIEAPGLLEGVKIGDSIAVNGVCLTVTEMKGECFSADIMAETMRRSSLSEAAVGCKVNLERAMAADGRFGGHIVSGHIDGTGTVTELKREDNAVWVSINAEPSILRLIVEKGSIAIDGISLTVAYVDDKCFKVSVIPHTGEETTLLSKKSGDKVNLENDIIGKYVEKLLGYDSRKKRNSDFSALLSENGFI